MLSAVNGIFFTNLYSPQSNGETDTERETQNDREGEELKTHKT